MQHCYTFPGKYFFVLPASLLFHLQFIHDRVSAASLKENIIRSRSSAIVFLQKHVLTCISKHKLIVRLFYYILWANERVIPVSSFTHAAGHGVGERVGCICCIQVISNKNKIVLKSPH